MAGPEGLEPTISDSQASLTASQVQLHGIMDEYSEDVFWMLLSITFPKVRPSIFCAITQKLIPSIRFEII